MGEERARHLTVRDLRHRCLTDTAEREGLAAAAYVGGHGSTEMAGRVYVSPEADSAEAALRARAREDRFQPGTGFVTIPSLISILDHSISALWPRKPTSRTRERNDGEGCVTMDYYRDKVVFITGAASGIGLELARQLVGLGARVVLADRDSEGCRAASDSLGQSSEAVTLDVTQPDDFEKALDSAWQRFGRVDIVVNNAGFGTGGEIADIDSGIWERIVSVNLMGVAHGCRLAFPRMAAQGGGQIVNIASMFGLLPGPLFAPYVATKHAVVGLSRSLRLEGKESKVKVTAVCPGFIATPLFDNAETAPGMDKDRGRESIPFRFLRVEKAAAAILRGVARNPERLVFPFEVRLLCWLDRMAPWLTNWLFLQSLRNSRHTLAAS